jgi:DNA polymerase III sliding clamp (beta) subunit (PCNA family)
MQLNAKIDAKFFASVMGSMGALVKEAKFLVTPDGIGGAAADGSSSAFVRVIMKKEAFKEYAATEGEIAIDLIQINGLLGEFDEDLTIEYDDKNKKLMLSDSTLKYGVRVLDPNAIKKLALNPNPQLPVKISLMTAEMKKAIRVMKKVTDVIDFHIKDGRFVVSGRGQLSDAKYEPKFLSITDKAPNMTATYTLEFVENFLKNTGGDSITIEFNSDYPLRYSYVFDNGNVSVSYLLAPRIEEK